MAFSPISKLVFKTEIFEFPFSLITKVTAWFSIRKPALEARCKNSKSNVHPDLGWKAIVSITSFFKYF